jgi:hypothetical protein
MANGYGGSRPGSGRKPKSYHEAIRQEREREQQIIQHETDKRRAEENSAELEMLKQKNVQMEQEIAFLRKIITALTEDYHYGK